MASGSLAVPVKAKFEWLRPIPQQRCTGIVKLQLVHTRFCVLGLAVGRRGEPEAATASRRTERGKSEAEGKKARPARVAKHVAVDLDIDLRRGSRSEPRLSRQGHDARGFSARGCGRPSRPVRPFLFFLLGPFACAASCVSMKVRRGNRYLTVSGRSVLSAAAVR
jgi:hypothetical protein